MSLLQCFFRDRDPGIASGVKCDHLCPGNGRIRILAVGGIAPCTSTVAFLRAQDEFHRILKGEGYLVISQDPVSFCQRQGCEAMVIHTGSDVSVGFVLILQNELDASPDVLGVWAVVGVLPVGEKGHDTKADHAGFAAISIRPVTVFGLATG